MGKFIDLTDKVFGRLTVLKRDDNIGVKTAWLCECRCGNIKSITSNNLRTGNAQSCGCLRRENIVKSSLKHGHSIKGEKSPEYAVWAAMLQRCNNPNNKNYFNYGGRGIHVCEDWHSFDSFIKSMGERPSKEHSIERIDNERGYHPNNCRWATAKEQARNRRVRTDSKTGVRGIYFNEDYKKYQSYICEEGNLMYLGSFECLDEAVEARKNAEKKYWKQIV